MLTATATCTVKGRWEGEDGGDENKYYLPVLRGTLYYYKLQHSICDDNDD